MQLRVFLILILSSTLLLGLELVDGSWNGKPWDRDTLRSEVKNNEPDALAEWAFCALESHLELPHNKQQIFRRSKLAAEKGSPLGQAVYAICAFRGYGSEINESEGRERMKSALESEHPEAIRFHGVYLRGGIGGYQKALEKGKDAIRQAAKAGSLNAKFSLAQELRTEEFGELDYEESSKLYLDLLVTHRLRRAAEDVFRFFAFGEFRNGSFRSYNPELHNMRRFFKDEHFKTAEKILQDSARRGHHYSDYLLIFRDIREGKLHERLPDLIENSLRGPESHRTINEVANFYRKDHKSDTIAVTIGGSGYRKAAETAYKMGMYYDDSVTMAYADVLMHGSHVIDPKKVNKGRGLLKDMFVRKGPSFCTPSHALGVHLCRAYFGTHRRGQVTPDSKKGFTRGMNHLVLHSKCRHAAKWIIDLNHRVNEHEMSDPSKALATIPKYLERVSGAERKKTEKIKEALLKSMTPEEKDRAKRLEKQKYPYGDSWRRKAFEALQKIGDIHPDEEFDAGKRFDQEDGKL